MQASLSNFVKVPPKDSAKPNYNAYTGTELKLICKKEGIKGYSKLKKDELVKLLSTGTFATNNNNSIKKYFEFDQTIKSSGTKRGSKKVLQYLVNSKKIVLLQRIKDATGHVVIYHPTTRFVFNEEDLKRGQSQRFSVIGYLSDDLRVTSLTKELIYNCKEWNFEYHLPENISTVDPTKDDNLEDDELDRLLYKTDINDDDDEEDDVYPNYEDLY